MKRIKKGDQVVVLAGKDKGKQGEITRVMPADGKAIVDGVNIPIRHTKQSQSSQGGRVPQAMPIQLFLTAIEPDQVDLRHWDDVRMFHVEHGKLSDVV